jgi:hypothetical protein
MRSSAYNCIRGGVAVRHIKFINLNAARRVVNCLCDHFMDVLFALRSGFFLSTCQWRANGFFVAFVPGEVTTGGPRNRPAGKGSKRKGNN